MEFEVIRSNRKTIAAEIKRNKLIIKIDERETKFIYVPFLSLTQGTI